jgi:hypothetical protein
MQRDVSSDNGDTSSAAVSTIEKTSSVTERYTTYFVRVVCLRSFSEEDGHYTIVS